MALMAAGYEILDALDDWNQLEWLKGGDSNGYSSEVALASILVWYVYNEVWNVRWEYG